MHFETKRNKPSMRKNQVMNEVIEHPSGRRYINVDSISDLLIFNPLGILLFSFDNMRYFFSNTIPIQDWSHQSMYNPWNHTLENTGQNYIMHFPFLGNNRIRPFVYWGIHGLAGCSYNMQNKKTISVGLGRVVNRIRNEIRETDYLENTIFFTPDMDGALSIFLSKEGSCTEGHCKPSRRVSSSKRTGFSGEGKSCGPCCPQS